MVTPTDFSVIAQTPGKTLTLTTCHPKGSARQRLVIKAELVSETANQPQPA
ncbi:Sortase family protein [compost metagenome]